MDNNLKHTELVKMIADFIKEKSSEDKEKQYIPVGVSNRHIHLSQEDLETLFGKGYKLNELKQLKQPCQYAANEVVSIAGPKGYLSNVRVLGPVREESQLEISKTDGFTLGVKCPVRESGNLKGSGNMCVIGPKGSIILKEKVIIAKRHIHMNTDEANKFNVFNGQTVSIVTTGERKVAFGEVLVRVHSGFSLECHLDVDEANACGLSSGDSVEIKHLSL
ncbi:phosphate propanoyltransferase [[Clostridium] dakarense]|uniref:phosphate propanoyltransferase n=1 Tax=Faecalimicrobium dakarense TaxID=1301100 RepID=UPI0004AE148D|nr:phosphate propanoyltransferase [[Clostridium] dakarense]